jgi:hypothetical protein
MGRKPDYMAGFRPIDRELLKLWGGFVTVPASRAHLGPLPWIEGCPAALQQKLMGAGTEPFRPSQLRDGF